MYINIYICIFIYMYIYIYIYIWSILMKIGQFQGREAMRGQIEKLFDLFVVVFFMKNGIQG